ncbi:MAG: hypothetical protein HC906_13480 [Bacteroidales bacterium]|nr:hypothetical protein [Bacteroidales bacterium]
MYSIRRIVHLSYFLKKDGLPGNSVKGILEDAEGNFWLSTNKGICRFNYEEKNFTHFSKEDGLNSNEFNVRSCLRATNGEFYFGGENGFNVFIRIKLLRMTKYRKYI